MPDYRRVRCGRRGVHAGWLVLLLMNAAAAVTQQPDPTATPHPLLHLDQLRATPNPVPLGADRGRTTISWETRDGAAARIMVSVDGAPEQLFAEGPAGSSDASWIAAGASYEFRLYAAGEDRPRATVTVRAMEGSGAAAPIAAQPVRMPWRTFGTVVLLAVFAAAVSGVPARLRATRRTGTHDGTE